MPTKLYTVEVQPDFIERQSKARPVDALAEMIWNGVDADGDRAGVQLDHNEFGLSSITITDNGHGIPYSEAATLFTRLGGFWKQRGGFTKTKHRMLHGFEGRGRFKVFALGRKAITSACSNRTSERFESATNGPPKAVRMPASY